MQVYQNISALNAQRQLFGTEGTLTKSMERLASGLRINRAADDAAGYVLSERMRREIRGYGASIKNAQDGVSLVQVADGAFSSVLETLHRMSELAILASNGDKTNSQRAAYDAEFQELIREIDQAGTITYNTLTIASGSFAASAISFQVGPEQGTKFEIGVTIGTLSADALGLSLGGAVIGITSQTVAQQAISLVKSAIDKVTEQNSRLGAVQNRLENVIRRTAMVQENVSAAEGRMRGLEINDEIVKFTLLQIRQQAGMAMLAQANLAPQAVIQLLR